MEVIILGIIFVFLVALFVAKLTDPTSRINIIESPFITIVGKNGHIELIKNFSVHTSNNVIFKIVGHIKSGLLILYATGYKKPQLGTKEQEVINQIHQIRFDPTKPFVITGGHFSQIFIRNIGVFYNVLVDGRLPTTQNDWENRQRIALQTIALDLVLLEKTKTLPTTFMPLWKNFYIPLNIYTYPSDTLFGILFALNTLVNDQFITLLYPIKNAQANPLQTQDAALNLLKQYKRLLQKLLQEYTEYVIDKKTHLVRKDINLASARDGIKRQSSFYDNVVAWSTFLLANNLGAYKISKQQLLTWREKIITTFWDEETGIFIDDLSADSKREKKFSADIFIVISSGFFDLDIKEDRRKLHKIVSYIQKHNLDVPLPLRYSQKDEPEKLYFFVKYFARSYMGETIWSHWGMEYIKTLLLLRNDNRNYYLFAKKHLNTYKQAIETYGGYPELYDKKGGVYHSTLYRSVMNTGWVVNYELAKLLSKTPID